MKPPLLVVCDSSGRIFEVPGLFMAAAAMGSYLLPKTGELIPLPESSTLFVLPKRAPVGFDPLQGRFVTVPEYQGSPVFAVAAFMPPGYLRTHHPAYQPLSNAPRLPLYCYSTVGWKNGRFYAAGVRIDRQARHTIDDGEFTAISTRARAFLRRFPGNRLVEHLVSNCVFKYRCANACNLVLGRWECPIPVSRTCNAACLGCISQQPKTSCVPASQHRLAFKPTADEIAQYVVPHLKSAPGPIASFGQGCEGEPLIEADLIEESIRMVRAQTKRGIINVNTNAGLTGAVERLCAAGLNSMRVSLNSARPDYYNTYYNPRGYTFENVVESIKTARRHGVWVSLNYLAFPGFTDHPAEIDALATLVKKTGLNMIQTRNLNIDPAWYIETMGLAGKPGKPIGMLEWVGEIKRRCPELRLGYFNPTAGMVRTE